MNVRKKQKKKLGGVRWLAATAMVLVLITGMGLTVSASATDAVNQARNGVLRVDLLYVDADTNDEYLLGSGSGFLVNSSTIITCAHVVNLSNKDAAKAQEALGEAFTEDYKERLKIRVVVMRDVYVYASIKNQSEATDFAILTLSDAIYDRVPLAISTETEVTATQQVYALGFPGVLDYYQNVNSYTYDDVSVTDGKVAKVTSVDNVELIQHSATLSGGNSGGPLVDENGMVIGMNNASIDKTYHYAIVIGQIAKALDALGVEYTLDSGSGSGISMDPDSEPDSELVSEPELPEEIAEPEVDDSNLTALIGEADNKELMAYTEETVTNFNEALTKAREVSANAMASQSEVDSAFTSLDQAINSLEEKPSGLDGKIIVMIIVVIVVIVAIVLVVVMAAGKKKSRQTGTISGQMSAGAFGSAVPPKPSPQPINNGFPPGTTEGMGETTVLGSGAGETTVLGGGQGSAKLIRMKTGENISVNGANFVLGKEKGRVSYCITGDSSISRSHAKLMARGGGFVITDLNSTNSTFVNGVRVEPGQEMPLKNGDRIKLSEEEFEFRV